MVATISGKLSFRPSVKWGPSMASQRRHEKAVFQLYTHCSVVAIVATGDFRGGSRDRTTGSVTSLLSGCQSRGDSLQEFVEARFDNVAACARAQGFLHDIGRGLLTEE